MTHTLSKDAAETLDELENYYRDKLAAVQAKRVGHGQKPEQREILAGEGVRIRINPKQREIVLSWANDEMSL